MVSAEDIPWEVIIFVLIFAIVLFYFVFFQGYLTAAIYRCIIKCVLPKNLAISFKYIQFSILSGHILIRDLTFTSLSMRVEIARLCVALKYWSKIPEFDENDKNDDKLNDKDTNNVKWIRSSHEPSEAEKAKKVKKKKGIFKTIFDRKSRFKVNIDGLHVTLYNQSEDAINRIDTFRRIYGLEKKTTEEATKLYNEKYPSNPPQAYQLSIMMRVILPLTFKVRGMLITIGNPNLPSIATVASKKIKGIFTMLKKEDLQHSLKQRLSLHMTEVKIRFVPNEEFDKSKFVKNSMRNLDERFQLYRNILYAEELNVIYTQDAFGCYIRSEDKDKAMLATAEPKSSVQIGIMSPKIEYGSYSDKLRSAFMRYFKPFLFINPSIYPNSRNRVKYMDIAIYFFGEKASLINMPFTTSQNLNESLVILFDNEPESVISMSIPQYVSTVEENKMEVECNFIRPRIRTSLSESLVMNFDDTGNDDDNDGIIIKSSKLLVHYMSFTPEKWFDQGISYCMISFERCKMKLAPYHIDFLTDFGTDFVSTYPFEPTVDDMDLFQPSKFYVTFKMVDAKIQLLSKTNPRFEEIFRIKNYQRMVIRTPYLGIDLQMPSLVYQEYEKQIPFSIQISSPTFKFFLPNDNMNQFRRNCYKWAHSEVDRYTDTDPSNDQKRYKFRRRKSMMSEKAKEKAKAKANYNEEEEEENNDFDEKEKEKDNFIEEEENDEIDENEEAFENEDDIYNDDHFKHKFIKHEFLSCSFINLAGSYKWNKKNGNKQFPLIIKVGPANGLISVVCIKSLLAVISNYSSSNKSHPNTDIHNKAFEEWVKPEPEFPDSVMHMQLNVQIIKADIGIPFDLYDTTAFISLHAAKFYLSVESYSPYFHVLIGLPSISVTFNKTHYPSERFFYERIGDGMIYGNPQEVLHIDGINFAIKNSQITKPKQLTLFSLMGIDVGEINGTISIYQLFALLDLAFNFMHLWFSFDVIQQTEPDMDSIFLPRQMQVSVRDMHFIVDFVQYGLMMINLPSGIIVYQDNIINPESHKAMFVSIPTIDVHHIYQPTKEGNQTMTKNKKKKKKKNRSYPRSSENSTSSHNKVASLIDSTSSLTNPNENKKDLDYEEEDEEEEAEEEKKENVNIAFLSQLRSVFHFTTYVSIIRRSRYNNYDFDSKLQMKYLNEYDQNHQFFDLQNLPQNIKLPKIFCNYDVTLDDEYTLTKTNKPDPNKENSYELQIHEIFFTSQDQYVKADISQLWLHLFQTQRFSSFGAVHKNDSFDLVEPNPENYVDMRRDMHLIISPNTKALMNMEYMIVLMLMVKTFNLQPDSHFLSAIARDVETDLWLKKILKRNNMSLILPSVLISLFDFNREVKLDLSINNINFINLKEIDVSEEMTLSISDISLNVYSKNDSNPAAYLLLSSINLGKINGDTSVRMEQLIGNAPVAYPLVKIINYSLSYILPIFKEIESPSVGGGMNDFKKSLEKYIDDEENLDVYYHPEDQNDNQNNNNDDNDDNNNNNNNENDDDFVNIDEDSNDHHNHHSHHSHHSHRKANKVKTHLPKFHIHIKKKHKKKKKLTESSKEDTSSGTFLSKESIVDEEKNTFISRYFLAYAKLCNDRKCLMNFVDNIEFDNLVDLENEEEEEIAIEEDNNNNNENNNENIRGNFSSGNYQNFSQNDIKIDQNDEDFANVNYQNNYATDGRIPQIKPTKTEGEIRMENEIKSKPIQVKKTVIRISKIQFNLIDNVCNIKLDPISLINKGDDFGVRFVIKSIYFDLKEDIFTFVSSIKKPKKDYSSSSASKKFNSAKKKIKPSINKEKKKCIIHFILNTLVVKLKVIKLDVKYLSALVNIANPPYASLSLMSLTFGYDDYGMVYLNGFDFNYSKEVNHGSFCMRPIGVKVSLDLLLNPKGCIDPKKIDLSVIKKRKKFRKSQMKAEEREKKQNEKTDRIIQKVKQFNQSDTKHSIIELLNNISFFFIVNEVKIEAIIENDSDFSANFTFPGARGVLFNPKNLKALLYLKKPEINVTNLLSMALIDVFMYGYYEPFPKQLSLFTMSGAVRVETYKETLKKIATLVNSLFLKKPSDKKAQQPEANRSRQLGRKSQANISLGNKHNSSSSIKVKIINSSVAKSGKKQRTSIDNFSNNALKVVNTFSNGINLLIRFTIPLITIHLPEIYSILNVVQPSVSVKCRNQMIFDASVENLNFQVDKSFISIRLRFTKENEEKNFIIDNLIIILTPSLFDQIIQMKNFFSSVKNELTAEFFHKIPDILDNIQSSIKYNANKIIDIDSFYNNKKSTMQDSNQASYDVPSITDDKYVIQFNRIVINLKLTNEKDKEIDKFINKEIQKVINEDNQKVINKHRERRRSSVDHHYHPQDGFVLDIARISLSMETRRSDLHNKTATAAQFSLTNLNFDDKNEKVNIDKYANKSSLSSVKCEEANISALSFTNHLNVEVGIKSFHISLYPTVPFFFTHALSTIKQINKYVTMIRTQKIIGDGEKKKISETKKNEMLNRRRSLTNIKPISNFVIFDVNIKNTAVIFNSPRTEFSIPELGVYGIFEKTNTDFKPQKLHTTLRVFPIQMSITPNIIHWFNKLLKHLEDPNVMKMMTENNSSSTLPINSASAPASASSLLGIKKHKKVAVSKLSMNLTLLVDQIEFNLGCQPSPVMLLFTLKTFVVHFTTKAYCASLRIGDMTLTTEKVDQNRKSGYLPDASSYRQKYMSQSRLNAFDQIEENSDKLLYIKIAPIDCLLGRDVQAFNVDSLTLSVSNSEVEDLFTFLKVWVEPLSDILKDVSSMLVSSPNQSEPTIALKPPQQAETNSNTNNNSNSNNSKVVIVDSKKNKKGELNIIARVQVLTISFGYSGVNGKIGLEIKPILFSNTKLSTNLRMPEITIYATGFVEGTIEIKPVIFQVNNEASSSKKAADGQPNKRLNSVIIVKSIESNIKSYSDPLLSFSLRSIYLFFLLIPPSNQILSLVVDSPKLKMTSQAISKFKRIISSIIDPIKDGITKTKKATISHDAPQTVQPHRLGRPIVSTFNLTSSSTADSIIADRKLKEKVKNKVKIENARLDLFLEKLQVELYKYYITDKEAVRATVTRASLTVDLLENNQQNKSEQDNSLEPGTHRKMNFVFYPMSLLRLFCNNGLVVDQRSVLLIPKIVGFLNTIQQNENVSYDFITKFSDSVEASLSITDYDAVMAILMFAIRNISSQSAPEIEGVQEVEEFDDDDNEVIIGNYPQKTTKKPEDDKNVKKKKRKFNFAPNKYQFSPQFKIALGAKIQPDVEWVLGRLGIKDEHVVPATLFQYVCIGLQDLLEYIAQTVTSD